MLTVNVVAATPDAQDKAPPTMPQLPLLEVRVKPDPAGRECVVSNGTWLYGGAGMCT